MLCMPNLEIGFKRVEERSLFPHAFEPEISFHSKIECVPNKPNRVAQRDKKVAGATNNI